MNKKCGICGEKPPETEHFIALIRKFKSPDEVSDTMFRELVDKIVVYEAQGMANAQLAEGLFRGMPQEAPQRGNIGDLS